MGNDSFQIAAERARRAYEMYEWLSLRPRERTEAIYRELRRIDANRAARDRRGDLGVQPDPRRPPP